MRKEIVFSAPHIKRYETDEFAPGTEPRFVAISLRGSECHLLCDHCRTRMLSALYHVKKPEQFMTLVENLVRKGCRGILVTGGCDLDGTIPLEDFSKVVREAKDRFGLHIASHTKMVTGSFAAAAVEAGIDLVMCDLVGADKPLQEVYHLSNRTIADVEASLDNAIEHGLKLAPHILIGIDYGKVESEYRALDMLKNRPFESLALVVLTPLRHTPMANSVIDEEGVLRFLEHAREQYPQSKLTLGCAKTWGALQRRFEEKALQLGFNAIAYPSEGIISLARQMGYTVKLTESCCAFLDRID